MSLDRRRWKSGPQKVNRCFPRGFKESSDGKSSEESSEEAATRVAARRVFAISIISTRFFFHLSCSLHLKFSIF